MAKAASKPSQAEIGRALGVVRSRVTALKRQGMPVNSVADALHWYRRYIMVKLKPVTADPEELAMRAVERAEALGRTVLDSMERGRFEVVNELRVALRGVPISRRGLVNLSTDVWEMLCHHVLRDIPESERGKGGSLTAGECEEMGTYWYAVAADEPVPF